MKKSICLLPVPVQPCRRAIPLLFCFFLLASCDSSDATIDDIDYLPPLNGDWLDASGQGLELDSVNPDDQLFLARYNVSARLTSAGSNCGGVIDQAGGLPLEGTIDNGKLVLTAVGVQNAQPCIEGTFADLRRIETTASSFLPASTYLNDRVVINLQVGLWTTVSADGPELIFVFPSVLENNSSNLLDGCNIAETGDKVFFDGQLAGYNTDNNTNPVAPELRAQATQELLFTNLELIDAGSMTMEVAGVKITLKRTKQTVQPSCPAS